MLSKPEESVIKKPGYKIPVYILIAYALSWAVEIPLALKAQGLISADIPFALHYLAAFGPFIAAVAAVCIEKGPSGLKDLFGRMIMWRIEPLWWLAALSPLLLFIIMNFIVFLFQGSFPGVSMLGRVDFLPELGIGSLFLWLATYGFGEETGWRGYLLPRLQRGRSALSATFILWIFWAVWHVPSFFYLNTVTGAGTLAGFLTGVLAGSILLTWLYNSSGGSILMAAIWHGLFDYVTACTECKAGYVSAVLSTIVIAWAVFILIKFKPANLSRNEKHVI